MPFINTSATQPQKEEKYRFVDEILSAPDYYRVLGIKKDCSPEEVRRAYIKVCTYIFSDNSMNGM